MQDLTSEFDRELLMVEEEATPGNTGFLEITVNGELVHSKRNGDGYVDSEAKFRRIADAVARGLQWRGGTATPPRPYDAPRLKPSGGRWGAETLGGATVAGQVPSSAVLSSRPYSSRHLFSSAFILLLFHHTSRTRFSLLFMLWIRLGCQELLRR